MLNYWWVTRPKRKLDSIPDVLALVLAMTANNIWAKQRGMHLSFEDALENADLKRKGERRDQGGGGARTYVAWLKSLGLIFADTDGRIEPTLAGLEILKGLNPVDVLSRQVFRYQFPSAYTYSGTSKVAKRFKVHPFWFIMRILLQPQLEGYLTEEEIAKILATEAVSDDENCVNYITQRVIKFRNFGDNIFKDDDFTNKYTSSRTEAIDYSSLRNLIDVANTMVNWLVYTQTIKRIEDPILHKSAIAILPERLEYVKNLTKTPLGFIARPEDHIVFQRSYGVWGKKKDTRNLSKTKNITPEIIYERNIATAFMKIASVNPIFAITPDLVDRISHITGIADNIVEQILYKKYGQGAIGCFLTSYYQMAFNGTKQAREFELATEAIFKNVFKFRTAHVGSIGLTPDVLLLSDVAGYQAIIDNKAYSDYSISNDHHNRMVKNYIQGIGNYANRDVPLAFFTYIAGGFGNNIVSQINSITEETKVSGSVIPVNNVIEMIKINQQKPYTHTRISEIFSLNKYIDLHDIQNA